MFKISLIELFNAFELQAYNPMVVFTYYSQRIQKINVFNMFV